MLENIHFVLGFSQSDAAVVRSLVCISQRAFICKHGEETEWRGGWIKYVLWQTNSAYCNKDADKVFSPLDLVQISLIAISLATLDITLWHIEYVKLNSRHTASKKNLWANERLTFCYRQRRWPISIIGYQHFARDLGIKNLFIVCHCISQTVTSRFGVRWDISM